MRVKSIVIGLIIFVLFVSKGFSECLEEETALLKCHKAAIALSTSFLKKMEKRAKGKKLSDDEKMALLTKKEKQAMQDANIREYEARARYEACENDQ